MRGRFLKIAASIVAIFLLLKIGLRLHAFVGLFFGHSGHCMTQRAIAVAHNASDTREPQIPRIAHQIFHDFHDEGNAEIPQDWVENRNACMELNSEWEFRLWDINDSIAFFEIEYPWFLETYDSYHYPVQRIDALRYFLLRHYGGIYIDLDNTCKTSLEAVRYFPAWTTDGGRGMLSNNILAATPNHPYFVMLTNSLIPYSWHYLSPYLTIMYASGQWFLTEIWEKYHASLSAGDPGLLRIEMDMQPGAAEWVFFGQGRGGTWNNWDNDVFMWTGDHVLLVVTGAFTTVLVFTVIMYALTRRLKRDTARHENDFDYTLLDRA